MPRAPFQVLIIPFRRAVDSLQYCIFERTQPKGQMQFIAGGGEDDESPIQAAARECFEEARIKGEKLVELTSSCHIPSSIFSREQREAWGREVLVIPEYSFGMEIVSERITLSDEHTAHSWVSYEQALSLLKWDSNKTALYELDSKIKMHII